MSDRVTNDKDASAFMIGLIIGLVLMIVVVVMVSHRTRIVTYGDRRCVYVVVPFEVGKIVNCYYPEQSQEEE